MLNVLVDTGKSHVVPDSVKLTSEANRCAADLLALVLNFRINCTNKCL